jgi:hypothetical protein
MKLTLGQIVDMGAALARLAECKLPIKTSWAISRRMKKLDAESAVYREKVDGLVKQYGEVRDGKPIAVYMDGPGRAECDAQITELRGVSVEVDIAPIQMDELEGIEVSPVDLIFLEQILQ